jgi:hypothetical protein
MAERLLRSCLAKFAVSDRKATLTHTSLSGGSYYVPAASNDEFLDAYVDCVVKGCTDLHLVERHRAVGPVLIDLDFKQASAQRLYDIRHIEAFCRAVLRQLVRFFVPSGSADLTIYVLEKEAPRPAKHGFKDGIHIVVPGAVARPEVMYAIRDALVPFVTDVFGSLGFTNTPDDIIDDSVVERNGWLLYGSRKPSEKSAWTLTHVFDVSGGSITRSSDPFPEAASLVRLFSIRNTLDESPLTDLAKAEIERREKIAEEIAQRAERAEEERRLAPPAATQDVRIVSDLVGLLSPARADKYSDWIRVGFCLHNIDPDLCFIWDEFSKQVAEKYEAGQCARRWARMDRPTARRPLTIGSLIKWAQDDSGSSAAFRDVMQRKERLAADLDARSVAMSSLKCDAIINAIRDKGGPLQQLHPTNTVLGLEACGDRRVIAANSGIIKALVDKDFKVYANTEGGTNVEFGLLFDRFPLPNTYNLKAIHDLLALNGAICEFDQNGSSATISDGRSKSTRIEIINIKDNTAIVKVFVNDNNLGTVPKSKMSDLMKTIVESQFSHAASQFGITQNVFNINFITNNNISINGGGNNRLDPQTPFINLRDEVLQIAAREKLRKLDGHVWRPVPGCPCAYEEAETLADFLNVSLRRSAAYHARPAMQRELLDYLVNYNPDDMLNLVSERDLLSFSDGILVVSELRFVPYGTPEFDASCLKDKVARHHIKLPYAPPGSPTPLFDSILTYQFPPEVINALHVMLGRTLFPIGMLDNWQVMPWLIGTAGTGKSIVLEIVAAMFSSAMTATMSSTNEFVFGLDGKYDKHVLIGRDLSRSMSSALSQEMLQCMVSGERISVPRKNRLAANVVWNVPMIFASNMFPDYKDNGGQIIRRLVAFFFRRPVIVSDPSLRNRIIESELPAIVTKVLAAYLGAVREHANVSFWSWCPPQLLMAQREVAVATSYVRRFLSLTEDDDESETNSGDRVFFVKDPTVSTSLRFVKTAFNDFMRKNYPGVRTDEVIDRATIELAGFVVEEAKNSCKACGRSVVGRRCCEAYSHDKRSRGMVAVGLSIERVAACCSSDLEA